MGAGSNCADHRGYAGYYRNRIHFECIEFDGYLRFHRSGSFKLKRFNQAACGFLDIINDQTVSISEPGIMLFSGFD